MSLQTKNGYRHMEIDYASSVQIFDVAFAFSTEIRR